jgi:hypothetical protein
MSKLEKIFFATLSIFAFSLAIFLLWFFQTKWKQPLGPSLQQVNPTHWVPTAASAFGTPEILGAEFAGGGGGGGAPGGGSLTVIENAGRLADSCPSLTVTTMSL